MKFEILDREGKIVRWVHEDGVIDSIETVTDLIGNADYQGADAIVLQTSDLSPRFFDLKSGFAGEMLQKFSNYHKRLAIVGDFENVESAALAAFIVECNRGRQVFFVANTATAVERLRE